MKPEKGRKAHGGAFKTDNFFFYITKGTIWHKFHPSTPRCNLKRFWRGLEPEKGGKAQGGRFKNEHFLFYSINGVIWRKNYPSTLRYNFE